MDDFKRNEYSSRDQEITHCMPTPDCVVKIDREGLCHLHVRELQSMWVMENQAVPQRYKDDARLDYHELIWIVLYEAKTFVKTTEEWWYFAICKFLVTTYVVGQLKDLV